MIKNKVLTYAAVFIIAILTFTLLRGYFTIFRHDGIFLMILASLIILLFPKVFLEKSIIWLVVYSLVVLFNNLSGDEYFRFKIMFREITFYFIPASLFLIYLGNKDLKNIQIITYVSIFIIIITSILTVFHSYNNLGLIRNVVESYQVGDLIYINEQYRKGIASYAMSHAFPFIVPPLIYVLKNKNFLLKKRSFALAIIIIGSLMVFYTESTGALVILLFSIIMSFIVTEKSLKKNIIRLIGLGLLVGVFLNVQTLISILEIVGVKTKEMYYYRKIEDAMTMLETGESVGQIANRQELHNMSLNAFLNYPFLGTNRGSDIGGHSQFMDRAGLLGLVGIIPLFLFFFFQIKITYRNLPNATKIYYLIGVTACIILGFQKNMVGFEYWLYLFFLLPSLCILLNSNVRH